MEDNEDSDEEEENTSEEDDNSNGELPKGARVTRSVRVLVPPSRMTLHQCHLITQGCKSEEYIVENGRVIAQIMHEMNQGVVVNEEVNGQQFIQTFSGFQEVWRKW